MDNVIKFSELGRREIKCLVYEVKDEGKIRVEDNIERINKLKDEVETPIIIYNPSQKQKEEIRTIMSKCFSKDGQEIKINSENIILDIIPILTNIDLDLHKDNEGDMKEIKRIIADPEPTFERAFLIVKEIVTELGKLYSNALTSIVEMTDEERETLKKISAPTLSDKELKKIELKKQLEDLDKEDIVVTPSNL